MVSIRSVNILAEFLLIHTTQQYLVHMMSLVRTAQFSVAASAFIIVSALALWSNADEPLHDASPPTETNHAAGKDFEHPGIAHSFASIEFVKGKLTSGQQPWSDAWARLKGSRHSDFASDATGQRVAASSRTRRGSLYIGMFAIAQMPLADQVGLITGVLKIGGQNAL